MILVQCAACAAPLGLSSGKKCGRCSTRYCGPVCQKQHWEEGGHDKLCRKIKKAGGAEQYYANTKYAEAVAVAAEASADDTKGQTCFICTQALHWKTKESLVRGCSCRGTAGFAHVSCLAEQAKILFAEGEENNLGFKALNERWGRWDTCSLCEQEYHGVVRCALGWACWKTYVGRPETDSARRGAMTILGNGLSDAEHHEDALSVQEAEVSTLRRLGESEYGILIAQGNLAGTYKALGRLDDCLRTQRDVYSGTLKLYGEQARDTLVAALNYGNCLVCLKGFEEAKSLLCKTALVACRVLGESEDITIRLRWNYAKTLYWNPGATLDDLRESESTLAETARIARRVLGPTNPTTAGMEVSLRCARAALRVREASETGVDVNSVRGAMEAMTPGDA